MYCVATNCIKQLDGSTTPAKANYMIADTCHYKYAGRCPGVNYSYVSKGKNKQNKTTHTNVNYTKAAPRGLDS